MFLLPDSLYGAHQLENRGTALTVINVLLTYPSCPLIRNSSTMASESLEDIITRESLARGIKETKWLLHVAGMSESETELMDKGGDKR